MAGFLYFLPGRTNPLTRDEAVALGLGYAFTKSIGCGPCMGDTPTKSSGLVFGDPQRLDTRGIRMERPAQTWLRLPKSQCEKEVWVGLWNAARPTPLDLARSPQLPGYEVKLAGDAMWRIPLVRRFDTQQLTTVSALPCYMAVDDDGNWQRGQVVETHAHLWDLTAPIASALLESYTESGAGEISDTDILRAVVALLAENYVVGAGELSLLRALTNEATTHAAAMAACDWPTFIAWADEQKKSDSTPAGSTTTAGGAD